MKFDLDNPRTLATTAVMTALVLGLTLIHIAQTPIGGYIHLGDIAVYFTAFAFGPWAGLFAGGVGTGLADVLSGYASFAPLSFVVHGVQGFVAGWLTRGRPTAARLIAAVIAGGVIVILGYFAGESLIPAFGGPAWAITEVPWNGVQELVGALGIALYVAVARAYPRLRHAE
jgi:energy-coupling factor transport system substrate-specific component